MDILGLIVAASVIILALWVIITPLCFAYDYWRNRRMEREERNAARHVQSEL